MARLAIFIDGAYLDFLVRSEFDMEVDLGKLANEVKGAVAGLTPEPVDLLRTHYYCCPPYQSNPPTDEERQRYSNWRRFADAIKYLPRFEFREGRLAFRGRDQTGKPIFQQKRVDLLLGVDVALLSGKRQITHLALVAGDSDFIPAIQVAKQEGVSICLFHGPRSVTSGYHQDLWQEADERHEMDKAFMIRCQKIEKAR